MRGLLAAGKLVKQLRLQLQLQMLTRLLTCQISLLSFTMCASAMSHTVPDAAAALYTLISCPLVLKVHIACCIEPGTAVIRPCALGSHIKINARCTHAVHSIIMQNL